MAAQPQIEASAENAKKCTRPKTAAGRISVEANPTQIFESNLNKRSQVDTLGGELELQPFERCVFALY